MHSTSSIDCPEGIAYPKIKKNGWRFSSYLTRAIQAATLNSVDVDVREKAQTFVNKKTNCWKCSWQKTFRIDYSGTIWTMNSKDLDDEKEFLDTSRFGHNYNENDGIVERFCQSSSLYCWLPHVSASKVHRSDESRHQTSTLQYNPSRKSWDAIKFNKRNSIMKFQFPVNFILRQRNSIYYRLD